MKVLIGKYAYTPIYDHSSTIYNSKVMQVTKASINRQIEKEDVAYTHTHTHKHVIVLLLSCVQLFVTHGLQHARLSCTSPSPWVFSNSCPLSWWCHTNISSSVIPLSFCLQSFPASGSFPMSRLFASGGQMIGATASASVLPKNIQDWFPLGLTNLISLHPKGLSRD